VAALAFALLLLLLANGNSFPHEQHQLLAVCSDTTLLSSFLPFPRLAVGWTISTDEIKNKTVLVGGMCVCLSVYLILVLWDYTDRDPASTLYGNTPYRLRSSILDS
jgi:hypothetical protein